MHAIFGKYCLLDLTIKLLELEWYPVDDLPHMPRYREHYLPAEGATVNGTYGASLDGVELIMKVDDDCITKFEVKDISKVLDENTLFDTEEETFDLDEVVYLLRSINKPAGRVPTAPNSVCTSERTALWVGIYNGLISEQWYARVALGLAGYGKLAWPVVKYDASKPETFSFDLHEALTYKT